MMTIKFQLFLFIGCGQVIEKATIGDILSEKYPLFTQPYPCEWTFSTYLGNQFQLEVIELQKIAVGSYRGQDPLKIKVGC